MGVNTLLQLCISPIYTIDMSSTAAPEHQIREMAVSYGFDEVRFALIDPVAGIKEYDRFLSESRHGEMKWMKTSRPPRAEPRELLPTVQSIVVLGMHYAHMRPPDPGGLTGKVASYAWGRDYHNLIGKRLRRLTRQMRDTIPGLETYAGVDSRPIIERAWAQQSGLGFIGKNAMAILPGQSSYFFLAAILVNIPLTPTRPLGDHCGTCTRCLVACPTDAFTAPGQLDARQCISYLTIEHRGAIPDDLKAKMGRWVFGCDDCQDICPHNPNHPIAGADDFAPRQGHAWLDLEWILDASDEALMKHFQGSPIRRPGPNGLKRNAGISLGNLGDTAARSCLKRHLGHPNDTVNDAIRWALEQIG